ncbi:MAG: hypothetical protein OEZ65_10840 [Gemmatimonadota bacterium]|nr:hypothetical protein [Gemmatimonadota bacterium]MDH5760074.1 hypothetical protein [Gemmatimonadota bacterium]
MSTRLTMTSVLALAVLAGCRPDDQRTETFDPAEAAQHRENFSPEVVAHLDSGSASYRRDDFADARDHYRAATEIDPEIAAAWFGVYMAEHALGNDEAAAEALRRAQSLVPGATLMKPSGADSIR